MGWQDRDYNRDGGRGDDYLSNPAAILGLSVPFGRWFGVPVRLHFWLLLTIAESVASAIYGASIPLIIVGIAILFVSLLIHDFGHRFAAQWVGGSHNEFMLWPPGGLIFPSLPPGAWPMFVGYIGGMLASLGMFVAASVAMAVTFHQWSFGSWDPLSIFSVGMSVGSHLEFGRMFVLYVLVIFAATNLLPYYWFDGGALLQSILWPFIGCYHAINVTCILGMLIAGPMVLVSMGQQNFMQMVFWVLLFSSAYTKRRETVTNGTGELEGAIAFSAMNKAPLLGDRRKKPKVDPLVRRMEEEEREQQIIDDILAKVSASGMNSLSKKERKFLADATERQRRK